ncbi:MAG: DUF1272 domain-containing protein [Alphaproteobacteria bacterium]|nr:MAG: DUF1272 domain-containing protein [Alphaproteobacteria bacterium]
MLSLRPSCEHCAKALPADSGEAMICSYECTFCADCVEHVLEGVCPNCGGNFVPRPIRPRTAWRPGVSLKFQPASEKAVHIPVDRETQREFARKIKTLEPGER